MTEVRDLLTQIVGPVAVVGSLNADLTVQTETLPRPGETRRGSDLEILPGGKSANQAVTGALLGAQVTMIGAVGEDGNGSLLLESLTVAGVDCQAVERSSRPTGTAVITVDSAAENTIVISAGANGVVDDAFVERHADAIAAANVLGLCLEIPMSGVLAAARAARASGVTVVFNLSPFGEIPDELLHLVDVLIVNEHELADMLDSAVTEIAWEDATRGLGALGVQRAVVTLGRAGSVVLGEGEPTFIEPVRVNAVDTTGCGDSFMGTLLAGLASSLTLKDAARLGSVVAARAATGFGAQSSYGTRAEIAQFIDDIIVD